MTRSAHEIQSNLRHVAAGVILAHALSGCVPATEECTFRDETVPLTEAGTNGMTGEGIQAEVATDGSFAAITLSEAEPTAQDETLAAHGPYVVTITPVTGEAILRSYDDGGCGEPAGSAAILAPVHVTVVSEDREVDVSGSTMVYGGDPYWFSATPAESQLEGQLPEWVATAVEAAYDDRCRGQAADRLAYALLSGDPAAFTLSVEVDFTGSCTSQARLAEVSLERM